MVKRKLDIAKRGDDVLLDKISNVKRHISRAKEEYDGFEGNLSRRDAVIFNIMLVCEQLVDISNYIVAFMKLGVPNSVKDSFELLLKNKIISKDLCEKIKVMMNLRNIIVHESEKVDASIIVSAIENGLGDLLNFVEVVLSQKEKIKIIGVIREIQFNDPRKVNELEKRKVAEAMSVVYKYYNDKKSYESVFLNNWRKHQLVSAVQGYNSKFYRICLTALELFFTDENNISRSNQYKEAEEIPDKDLEEYYKYFI